MIIVVSAFSKSSVFKMFSVHTKTKTRHFQFLPFEERVGGAPFSDGLVWTVGLTGEIHVKLPFQISLA